MAGAARRAGRGLRCWPAPRSPVPPFPAPPPLHPIQMQLPLPCQPLALNSSLREVLPSEQQRNRKQAGSGLPGSREGVTLMDVRCLKGDENVKRESCSHRHNLNMLNTTAPLNRRTFWCVAYTSVKLLFKKPHLQSIH